MCISVILSTSKLHDLVLSLIWKLVMDKPHLLLLKLKYFLLSPKILEKNLVLKFFVTHFMFYGKSKTFLILLHFEIYFLFEKC